MKFHIFVPLLFSLSIGCASSKSLVSMHESVYSDEAYNDKLEENTRNAIVNKSFQRIAEINVTLMSSDFKKMLEDRVQKVYLTSSSDLTTSSQTTGVFVSIFSPEDKLMELENSSIWTIALQIGEEKHFPIKVKKIYNKKKWENFFPYINMWTHEYFVLFNSPLSDESTGKLVKEEKLDLILSNVNAKIKLIWP